MASRMLTAEQVSIGRFEGPEVGREVAGHGPRCPRGARFGRRHRALFGTR